MSTLRDVLSRFEQLAIFQFLTIEKCSAAEIHKLLKSAYGNGVMSIQHVRKWRRMFEGERTSITNNERVGPSVSVSTDDLHAKIDAVIQSNQNVRLSLIANEVNALYGTVQKIVTEDLKYRKICSHWVPHSLSPEQKHVRIDACQQCLKRCWKEGNAYLCPVMHK